MSNTAPAIALDTGDRVRATVGLGSGFFRPQIAAGAAGIIVRTYVDDRFDVHFGRGCVLKVSSDEIRLT